MSIEDGSGVGYGQRVPNAIERYVIRRTHTDIPDQMERERAIVIPGDGISDQEAQGLPTLVDHRIKHSPPRGALYINRYKDTGVRIDLPETRGVIQLPFDSMKVIEGKWARYDDVETAIRACDHIADSYDRREGIQTVSVLEVNRLVHDLSRELQLPASERSPLEDLEARAIQVLVNQGYDRAHSLEKKRMASEIMRALQKDSLDRENPSRGRLILANLRPLTTRVLLGNENKRNKYRYLGGVLYREREGERFALGQLSGAIKDLGSMGRNDFQNRAAEEAIRHKALVGIAPGIIKVAPYVQVAAEARFLMNSRKTVEDVDRLRGYVGDERADILAELPSYYDLKTDERRQRLFSISESIDQELGFADTQLPLKEAA